MLVTTTQLIEDYKIIEYKGIVRGLVVRSPNIMQGFLGGLKNVVGGKIGSYAQMCEKTRLEAFDLMVKHAAELQANAVIGMNYDTSELGATITEVLCYGTAVIVAKQRRS